MKIRSKKTTAIIGVFILFLLAFLKFYVGFNHISEHIGYAWRNMFSSETKIRNTEAPHIASETVYTTMSNNDSATQVINEDDLLPIDTTRSSSMYPELQAKNKEIVRNAQFNKLKLAEQHPTNEDASAALIRLTNGRLTEVIKDQKLDVKIGQCYENPNVNGNYNCVSCMILLYNSEKKDWQAAPNGENFLKNAYDFYQPSKGDPWAAKGISMRIPYDYELFKKYESK